MSSFKTQAQTEVTNNFLIKFAESKNIELNRPWGKKGEIIGFAFNTYSKALYILHKNESYTYGGLDYSDVSISKFTEKLIEKYGHKNNRRNP